MVALAGEVFGREAVQGEVTNSLKGLLGENGAQAVNGMLASAAKPQDGLIATIVGIVTLIFAAIGVVVMRLALGRCDRQDCAGDEEWVDGGQQLIRGWGAGSGG